MDGLKATGLNYFCVLFYLKAIKEKHYWALRKNYIMKGKQYD
jgi:hypothetical protein